MNKLRKRFWIFLSAFVLCAGITVIVSCTKDDECKECTSKANGDVKTLCGDELSEAKLNPLLTCK